MNQRTAKKGYFYLEDNVLIRLDELKEKLGSLEVYIITHYYGIDVDRSNLWEIAETFALTAERIELLKNRALLKLTNYCTD